TKSFLYNKIANMLDNLPFLKSIGLGHLGDALGKGLGWLSSGQGVAALTGFLTLMGWLASRNKPGDDEAGLMQLNEEVAPLVWNPGGATMAAGLAFLLMGNSVAPS